MDFTVNLGQEMGLSAFQLLVNCPDPAMREVVKLAEMATRSRSAMITGETGVGKEVVAKAIHEKGPHSANHFVVVNCGNQNHGIMGSELFGHEKGAFTGAFERHVGFCEKANGGTLFLDEIGDLPLDLQTRLLRLLEDYSFTRVGGTEVIRSEFMVISATNRNLRGMIDDGNFRQDLFYRLNVFPIRVPPLRERPCDVGYFGKFFTKQYSSGQIVLSEEATKCLESYPWPGNVRELRNSIERAVILVNGNEDRRIHPCHLELDHSAAQTKIAGENAEPASKLKAASEIAPDRPEAVPEATGASDSDTGSRAIPRNQTQTLQYEYGSIRAAPFYLDWVRDPKDLEPEISAMKLAGLAYEHTLEEILGSIKNPSKKSKEFRSKRWALYVAIYIMVKDLELDRKKIASFLSGISGEGSDLASLIGSALTLIDKKSRCDSAVARDVNEIRAHFRKAFMGLSS
jgi:transcriptional regulator with AAA-type ATPase domain